MSLTLIMNKTPWNSIAESIVQTGSPQTLGHAEALQSPCMSCETAPCCTHLPLNSFKVTNLVELDHALYLLNFDRIELGVSAAGDWSSYYTYPCRFLDRERFKCTIHATPEQPRICQHYNPYNCWYKRVFSVGQREEFVRIDYERMQYLLPHIEFNDERQIVSVPAWDELISMMKGFEDQPRAFSEIELVDAAFSEWEQIARGNKEAPPHNPMPTGWFSGQDDPCAGCAAYCCKTLVFQQSLPVHVSNLDYFRFCLGFPGVELGISDHIWSLVVKTQCRHLDEQNRCSLFDMAERPLICKYYDAWKCDYKPQFGQARPVDFLRLRLEQYQWVTENIPLDDKGTVLGLPPIEMLRQRIEANWWQEKQND